MAIALLSSALMREMDRITIESIGIMGPVLMETAGRACAQAAVELLTHGEKGRFVVMCGKGNNGGDGFVAARTLHHWGHDVSVMLFAQKNALVGDALANKKILDRLGLPIRVFTNERELVDLELTDYDVVIDALLGTGLSSELKGLYAKAVQVINSADTAVLSVDIPSGISSDTGHVLGHAVMATRTVTFGFPKIGQILFPGTQYCGELMVADIGIPPDLPPKDALTTWLLEEEDLFRYCGPRDPDAHKGHFGHLVVLAGSLEKPGAAGLCCLAAARTGAGLVTLAGGREVLDRVVRGPVEFMGAVVDSCGQLEELCRGKQALAVGPGLGLSERMREIISHCVVNLPVPVVVDADGLNNLVGSMDLLRKSKAERILTPHPGEMSRLLGITTGEVQRDRPAAARKLAAESGCISVLKGARTVIAEPNGQVYIVPAGNPGMAGGGTGDVLTGMIGSMLAQGFEALDAAIGATYLHALAGDAAALEKGQQALLASDIIAALPTVMKRLESRQDEHETGSR